MSHREDKDQTAPCVEQAQPLTPRRFDWQLLALLLAILVVVGGSGSLYLKKLDAKARVDAQHDLTSVAELKVQEIVQWRKERLRDATYISHNPYIARRVLETLAQPEGQRLQRLFKGWLDALMAGGNYKQILLLDPQLNVCLTYPEQPPGRLLEPVHRAAESALRTREIVEADWYQATTDSRAQLSFVVPLVFRRDATNNSVPAAGAGESAADQIAGLVVLQVDPEEFLYPLLQTWPASSRTAETLLVRREGDDVVFLNELRHRKGTALSLRRPVSNQDLPAAMAARGIVGTVEGVDYRGVPVLAAVQPVPGSPWFLEAKMDQQEVYATLRQEARIVWGGLASLTAASCLGLVLFRRRRDMQLLRDQMEAERERDDQIRAIGSAANDAIIMMTSDGRISFWNEAAERIFGYSKSEALLAELHELLVPARFREPFRQAFAGWQQTGRGAAIGKTLEMTARRKEGAEFPVELSLSSVQVKGQWNAVGIIRDIAERKEHEREIERWNRLYATLSQVNQAIVRARSREELLPEVCRVASQFGGFKLAWISRYDSKTRVITPLACAGEPQEFIHRICHTSEAGPEHGCLCGQAVREECLTVANDLRLDPRAQHCASELDAAGVRSAAVFPIRLNGKVWGVFAVCSAEPNVFQYREVAMLVGTTDDIAFGLQSLEREQQRERAEVALRESEEKYRLLVENAHEAIFVVQDGKFRFANDTAHRMVGLTEPELIGRSVLDFVSPEDHEAVRQNTERLLGGSATEILKEYRVVDHRGALSLVSVNSARIAWRGKPALLNLASDVTERKALETQLRQAQKMEGVGQLAGGVAHDFNNMLAVIRGNAELLLIDSNGLGAEAREGLSHIAAAADRAANLTRQLLIFSRKQVMQFQPVALNALIGNLIRMLRRVIREDIRLECVYGEPLPFVQGDTGMMEQVLLNLVVNARDAMPQGGQIHITTERVSLEPADTGTSPDAPAGEFVCLSVSDTGTGIAPEVLPHIFEPFFTTKEVGKGTGLGLATVYGIVNQHQGRSEVSSRIGEGTTFKIFLPAIPPPAQAAASLAEAGSRGRGEAILLVEDDFAVRMITRRVLESFKYEVHDAASGPEALEVWSRQGPEIALLLTDMVMPGGMTGWDLAQKLQAERPELKVIVMSGYNAEAVGPDTEFLRRAGSYFISKPCPSDTLTRTVRRCLDEH